MAKTDYQSAQHQAIHAKQLLAPIQFITCVMTMRTNLIFLFFLFGALLIIPSQTLAQTETVSNLEHRVYLLENIVAKQTKELSRIEEIAKNTAPLLFLFGAFCALWAQNTGRNAWIWFFAGGLFSVFTIVALLIKNEPSDYKH